MVMIETVSPNGKICIRDSTSAMNMATGLLVNQCGVGRMLACFNAPTNATSVDLIVYCDASCRSSPVPFWFKVTNSAPMTWLLPQGPLAADGTPTSNSTSPVVRVGHP